MNRSWNFRRGVLLALAGYTAFLVFAAPKRCADALQAGLRLCGGPLLVSLFPFLIVSALAAGCGAGQWLGFVFRPAARLMGIRAKGAGGVLLIGALGGFAPAAVAASEAVRTGQLTSRQASALLPACVCSGPSFVILTVGQQMLGSRAVGVRLFAAQLLAGYLTAALLCRMQGGAGQAPPAQGETIPLPALDGGRLVFLFLEVLRGKPIPPEKEGIIHFAGFVALMVLMVFVMFNDIQRIIG